MKKFTFTLATGLCFSFAFGQEVSKLVQPTLMRTCIKSGAQMTASDCTDKKLENVAIMRWDNDRKISIMGRKEEGFGQIYDVVSSKQNQQHGYLEWYVREITTGEIAAIVFDDADSKVAVSTKTTLKAFYYK